MASPRFKGCQDQHSLRRLALIGTSSAAPFSKNDLERQLQLAVVVRLARNRAERAARRCRVRSAPVRMVEEIENIESALHGESFDDRKVLPQAGISRPEWRITQVVALLRTVSTRRRLGEYRSLEPDETRGGKTPHRDRTITRLIPELVPAARSYTRDILARPHRKRGTRLIL